MTDLTFAARTLRKHQGLAIAAILIIALGVGANTAAVEGEAAAGNQAQAPTMASRIGVFLRSTGREDPAEALAAVKALGIGLIQISRLPERFYTPDGAREFDRMMKDAGVRAASVVVVFEGESYRDLNAVETTVGFRPAHLLDARLAYARKCVDFAAALGVKIVTFHMGVLPKDPADPTYRRMLDAVTSLPATPPAGAPRSRWKRARKPATNWPASSTPSR